MKRLIVAALALCALTACDDYSRRQWGMQPTGAQYSMSGEQIRTFCDDLGIGPDHPRRADCMVKAMDGSRVAQPVVVQQPARPVFIPMPQQPAYYPNPAQDMIANQNRPGQMTQPGVTRCRPMPGGGMECRESRY